MFTYHSRIKLYDTDAAGIMFFGDYFRVAHDAYQEFMYQCGFSFHKILNEMNMMLLVAHAEADYNMALEVDEAVKVVMKVEKIGQTSYILTYDIADDQNRIAASLKTVHVAVSKTTGEKVPLPDDFIRKLKGV